MIISGIIRDGKLSFPDDDSVRYSRWLSSKKEGSVIRIEAKREFATRSVEQNAYYHGCVVEPLRKHIGLGTPDEMHDVLKDLHLSESVRMAFDKRRRIKVPKSTKDLTTVEFEAYLERIRRWARKFLKFEIPLPNDSPFPYDPK